MAETRELGESTKPSTEVKVARIGLKRAVIVAIIGLTGTLCAAIIAGAAPIIAKLLFAPTATSTPTPTKTPVTVSPTTTGTPTLTPVPSPTPTPTPYYVEIVVDASERMSAKFEGGTTKMESAWQTAGTIAGIRAQQGQFVTTRLFGGRDSPGEGSCLTSYSLFDFTNDSDQIMNYLAESPSPRGEAAVVRALLDAAQELNAHENIGREIILLTGGDDGCNVALSAFYNSANQSLWTQTFVVLFSDEDLGTFITLETEGANIYYDLVRNREEAETVAVEIGHSPPPTPTPMPSSSLPPPPTPMTGGEAQPASQLKATSPPPTRGVATTTRPPTPTDTPVPPTDTPVPPADTPVPPTDTPVPPTDTPVPPTDTPVPPTDTPTQEVTYDSGSRTITIHRCDIQQPQAKRLCKGKMADVGRNAVFLRTAYLQQFGESAGLKATVTHVFPEKGINITLPNVEVGQYNDTEIDASGEQLNYTNCVFNAVQGMRNQLGLPPELGPFDDPSRCDYGTITIQLSSEPVEFISKEKSVESGIFAASDQASMASRAYTFRQFYWRTAAINGTAFSPGSDDNTCYQLAYDRVDGDHYSGWEIVLPETNVSSLSKLAFDIRGQSSGENPNVWLTSPGSPKDIRNFVDIEDYVTVSTDWQRVVIPLDDFHVKGGPQTIDRTRIILVQIVFEWEDMAGMVYVDGFAFE